MSLSQKINQFFKQLRATTIKVDPDDADLVRRQVTERFLRENSSRKHLKNLYSIPDAQVLGSPEGRILGCIQAIFEAIDACPGMRASEALLFYEQKLAAAENRRQMNLSGYSLASYLHHYLAYRFSTREALSPDHLYSLIIEDCAYLARSSESLKGRVPFFYSSIFVEDERLPYRIMRPQLERYRRIMKACGPSCPAAQGVEPDEAYAASGARIAIFKDLLPVVSSRRKKSSLSFPYALYYDSLEGGSSKFICLEYVDLSEFLDADNIPDSRQPESYAYVTYSEHGRRNIGVTKSLPSSPSEFLDENAEQIMQHIPALSGSTRRLI